EIVLAAADDRRRVCGDHAFWTRQSRQHPEVQLVARKQPLAGHLAAGDRARGDQLIELALAEPQVICGLAGGQEFHPAPVCIFLCTAQSADKSGIATSSRGKTSVGSYR